jgi:hypothetical protein
MLFRKLDYIKILSIDLYLFECASKEQRKRRVRGALYNLLFKRKFNKAKNDIVFFQSMRRNDYDKMFNEIVNVCSLKYSVITLDNKYDVIDILFLYYLICAIATVRFTPFNITTYLFSVITLASYLKYVKCLGKNVKMLIVHSDMQPIDNLLAQVVKIKGGVSVTLQHGLYVDYSEYDNVNKYNYLSCVSDYFLAWGEETGNLINKYNLSNVIICGKPSCLTIHEEKDDEYFTVVFDQNIFHKQNILMLSLAHEISEKLNLKMNLRLHPENKLQWYRHNKSLVLLGKDIASSKFIIGHTSSLLYECLKAGIPTFRLKTHIPANECDNRIVFSNIQEFFKKFEKKDYMDFSELGEFYIKYCGDKSLSKYGAALDRIYKEIKS